MIDDRWMLDAKTVDDSRCEIHNLDKQWTIKIYNHVSSLVTMRRTFGVPEGYAKKLLHTILFQWLPVIELYNRTSYVRSSAHLLG